MSKRPKIDSISVFLPCLNEEQNLLPLIEKAHQFLAIYSNKHEIIVVDDGSTDNTVVAIKKISKKIPNIKLIHHSNNLGYGAAIQSGIQASQYKWIFFTDGDGQFNIQELEQFIPYTHNFKSIIGYRTNRAEGSIRAFNAGIFKLFIDIIFRVSVKDIDCAFKLFEANTIKSLDLNSTGAMISAELLYKLKKNHVQFKQLPVTHYPRIHGSPTGNSPSVIIKAGVEAIKLYLSMKLFKSK